MFNEKRATNECLIKLILFECGHTTEEKYSHHCLKKKRERNIKFNVKSITQINNEMKSNKNIVVKKNSFARTKLDNST